MFLRRTAAAEDLQNSDLLYSTVYCYIGILLRCPPMARLLINPYYVPSTSPIDFIRPRCGTSDMKVWRHGVFGFTPDVASFLGSYEPVTEEYHAIQTHAYSRLTTYLATQSKYFDRHVVDRIETILHHDNFHDTAIVLPYQQSWETTSLSFRKQHSRMAINQAHDILHGMSRKQISSSARILIWYRSEKALSKAWISMKDDSNISNNAKSLLKRIFRGLLQAEWRLKLKLRLISDRKASSLIRSVVDDFVDEVISRCIRGDFVGMNSSISAETAFSSLVVGMNAPTSSNMLDPLGAAKSLSLKFTGKFLSSQSRDPSMQSPSPDDTSPVSPSGRIARSSSSFDRERSSSNSLSKMMNNMMGNNK